MNYSTKLALFIVLLFLLVVAITFFSVYPILKRKSIKKEFKKFCVNKVEFISSSNGFRVISNLDLLSYENGRVKIDHVIFGNKYIYIVTDYPLIGSIIGDKKDNSWLYKKFGEKHPNYIENLFTASEKNIGEFIGIINENPHKIVAISLIPDECTICVKPMKNGNSRLAYFSEFGDVITAFENEETESLDQERISQIFELIRYKNEEEKRANN